MFKRVTAIAALAMLTGLAFGQGTATPTAKPAAVAQPANPERPFALMVGDKAPAMNIAEWVKGDQVTGFEKGKVYVVEFWATWCGPCIASMPHITELQKKYADKGLTVIGVTSEDPNNTLDGVKKMVKEKAANGEIGYSIAWDTKRETNQAYMKAAGQSGIPCSYVVNRDGQIAYIGHPMKMDATLEAVINNTHDIKAAAAAYTEQAKNRAVQAVAQRAMREFQGALKAKDFDKVSKVGAEILAGPLGKNAQAMNEVAWSIVDPEAKVEKKDLDLAMKAASRANELTEGKDAAILDTLARVHFCKGDVAKAIELQKKAIELAQGPMKADLETVLKEYQNSRG